MTMEMANILLKNLRDIKTTQVHKKPSPPSGASSTTSVSTLPVYQPHQAPQTQPQHHLPPDRPAPPPQQQHLPPTHQQQAPLRPSPPPGSYGAAEPKYGGPTAQQPPYPQGQQPYPQQRDDFGGQGPRPGPGGGRPMPQAPQQPPTQHRQSFEKPRPQDGYAQVRGFTFDGHFQCTDAHRLPPRVKASDRLVPKSLKLVRSHLSSPMVSRHSPRRSRRFVRHSSPLLNSNNSPSGSARLVWTTSTSSPCSERVTSVKSCWPRRRRRRTCTPSRC